VDWEHLVEDAGVDLLGEDSVADERRVRLFDLEGPRI